MKKTTFIGIDPDTEKNGVAIYKNGKIDLLCLDLFDMFNKIHSINCDNEKLEVVIERGAENISLFNAISAGLKTKGNLQSKLRVSANVGSKIGRNFEVTNVIEQWCKYMNINHSFFVPKGSKYTHEFVKNKFDIKNRTNPEKRDALRCIARFITKTDRQ